MGGIMNVQTISKTASVSALAIVAAGAAGAQEYYAGLGATVLSFPNVNETGSGATLFGGVKWSSGQFSYGAEVDFTRANVRGAGVNVDVLRLRGIVAYDMGKVEVFGALGIARTSYNTGFGYNSNGASVGIGAQVDITDNLSVRGQIDHSFNNGDPYSGATSATIGVVYNF